MFLNAKTRHFLRRHLPPVGLHFDVTVQVVEWIIRMNLAASNKVVHHRQPRDRPARLALVAASLSPPSVSVRRIATPTRSLCRRISSATVQLT